MPFVDVEGMQPEAEPAQCCIAAQRSLTCPVCSTESCESHVKRGTSRYRADDISCRIATENSDCSAVLNSALRKKKQQQLSVVAMRRVKWN